VSSSGHLALVPRLLGWDYAELPAETRKAFEVALHAGSAPALVLALRGESLGSARLLALTLLPPAAAGLRLARRSSVPGGARRRRAAFARPGRARLAAGAGAQPDLRWNRAGG
jgi:hypothetical protein